MLLEILIKTSKLKSTTMSMKKVLKRLHMLYSMTWSCSRK